MSVAAKLGAYVVGLAVVFGAALGVGSLSAGAVGDQPAVDGASHADADDERAGHDDAGHDDAGHDDAGHDDAGHDATDAAAGSALPAGGLMISDRGYSLALASTTASAGPATPLAFQVTGPGGDPVREYETAHDRPLHLIVVRRDLTGFQHVHPELAADGTWSTQLALEPGTWRVFADLVPADLGQNLILGADLTVPGELAPTALPEPARTAEVDGYSVALSGDLVAGQESAVTLSVSRDGRPVSDLEPYLGAYGHLVALRAGDLAYLHVHPEGEPGDGATPAGPDVDFSVEVPSAGDYRLFFDFEHQDVVRTAGLTVGAAGGDS